jgi:hypothetical protein
MRIKIDSGWIGTALSLLAAGAPLMWPESGRPLAIFLFALAAVVFILGVRIDGLHVEWGRRGRRVPLIGMAISAVFFAGFTARYFWSLINHQNTGQAVTKKQIDELPSPNKANEPEKDAVPDVALAFSSKTSPNLIIENNSEVVAETIKWSPAIWNIDDPRTYINSSSRSEFHDPLPIPTQTFDFLRPHSKSLPIGFFDTPNIRPFVKPGQRLVGVVSVICPKCKRSRTYVISVVYRESGWY